MSTLDATSLSDLLQKVEAVKKKWKAVWYRGVRGKHPLVAKVFREASHSESYALKQYRLRAEPYVDRAILSDPVRLLCRAQHYDVETRLLDWTDSILMALYFAYDTSENDEEHCLWLLDPASLNDFSIQRKTILMPGNENVLVLAEVAQGEEQNDPQGSLAFYPYLIDKRMEAQRSCFTITGPKLAARASLNAEIEAYTIQTEAILLRVNLGRGVKADFERLDMRRTLAFPSIEHIVRDIHDERRRVPVSGR